MNETVLLIISYLPAAISLVGSISAAIYSIKKVTSKVEDLSTIKNHLGFVCKKLSEAHEENAKLRDQISALRLEIKGHRDNEKGIKKN